MLADKLSIKYVPSFTDASSIHFVLGIASHIDLRFVTLNLELFPSLTDALCFERTPSLTAKTRTLETNLGLQTWFPELYHRTPT